MMITLLVLETRLDSYLVLSKSGLVPLIGLIQEISRNSLGTLIAIKCEHYFRSYRQLPVKPTIKYSSWAIVFKVFDGASETYCHKTQKKEELHLTMDRCELHQ